MQSMLSPGGGTLVRVEERMSRLGSYPRRGGQNQTRGRVQQSSLTKGDCQHMSTQRGVRLVFS
jgi:hypothetical protein